MCGREDGGRREEERGGRVDEDVACVCAESRASDVSVVRCGEAGS